MNDTTLFRKIGTISRTAMNDMNKIAREYDLDNNLFLYLFRIVETPGLSLIELTNLVKYEKSTISRALKKLEKLELIEKKINPKNKKYILIHPTKKAELIYKKLIKAEQNYIADTLAVLKKTEKESLLNLLNKIEVN